MYTLKTFLFLGLLIVALEMTAQVQVATVPFSAATPFLEPDGRKEIIRISDNDFVVLSKIKGGLTGGDSEYSLERYNATLDNLYKVPLTLSGMEDVKELYYNGNTIILFIVFHNEGSGESKLIAQGFNPATGAKMWDKTLMTSKVGAYQSVRYRGAVEETFDDAVCSSLNKNFVVHFTYQYYITYSPDGNKILAYQFEYDKPTMVANAVIMDKNLTKITEGIIPIDNNFINYGVFINNRGEVYILNVDKLGRIVLIQFNMETKDNKLLDIQYSSTQRQNLKLQFLNDDEVYVGSISTMNGKLLGVMYLKFNFTNSIVEKINFHDFSEGLLQTADAVRAGKNLKTPENWKFYELTHFHVNKFGKVLMALEKREIQAIDYLYETEATLEGDKWKERMGKVNSESMIMVSFNANDELMWENYYYKSQTADLTTGLISASVIFNYNDEVVRAVYASSSNATGIFNIINFVEWDATNGSKVKEMELQNDESVSLVRNYSLSWDDKMILVGRKGLLGKKYIMTSYKFSPDN